MSDHPPDDEPWDTFDFIALTAAKAKVLQALATSPMKVRAQAAREVAGALGAGGHCPYCPHCARTHPTARAPDPRPAPPPIPGADWICTTHGRRKDHPDEWFCAPEVFRPPTPSENR